MKFLIMSIFFTITISSCSCGGGGGGGGKNVTNVVNIDYNFSLNSSEGTITNNSSTTLTLTTNHDYQGVEFYLTNDCSGVPEIIFTSNEFAQGVDLSLTSNTSATYYAKFIGIDDPEFDCKEMITIIQDIIPPSDPTTPASFTGLTDITNVPSLIVPIVVGDFPAGSEVLTFCSDSLCTNIIGSVELVDVIGGTNIVNLTLTDNSTTSIHSQASDYANNTSAVVDTTKSITVDTIAPGDPGSTAGISAIPSNTNISPYPVNIIVSDFPLGSEILSVCADSVCSVILGSVTLTNVTGGQTTFNINLPDGISSLYLSSQDSAGNESDIIDMTQTVNVDTIDPTLTIDRSSLTYGSNESVVISCENGITYNFSGSTIHVEACSGGSISLTNVGAMDVAQDLTITATDPAGNISALTVTLIEDSSAPTITGLASTMYWSVTEDGNFQVSVSSNQTLSEINCYDGGTTLYNITTGITNPQLVTTSLNANTNFTCDFTDEYANVTSESVSLVIDNTAPSLNISSAISTLNSQVGTLLVAEILGTISDSGSGIDTIEWTHNGVYKGLILETALNSGFDAEYELGTNSIDITLSDIAGNSTTNTYTYQRNPVPWIIYSFLDDPSNYMTFDYSTGATTSGGANISPVSNILTVVDTTYPVINSPLTVTENRSSFTDQSPDGSGVFSYSATASISLDYQYSDFLTNTNNFVDSLLYSSVAIPLIEYRFTKKSNGTTNDENRLWEAATFGLEKYIYKKKPGTPTNILMEKNGNSYTSVWDTDTLTNLSLITWDTDNFVEYNGYLYFPVYDNSLSKGLIYRYDGTNFEVFPKDSTDSGCSSCFIRKVGSKLVFENYNSFSRNKLFTYDGTTVEQISNWSGDVDNDTTNQ